MRRRIFRSWNGRRINIRNARKFTPLYAELGVDTCRLGPDYTDADGSLCLVYSETLGVILMDWREANSLEGISYEELLDELRVRLAQPPATAFQTQEGGKHYSQMPEGYQPFQISKALGLNPVEHTVLKYLLRHGSKNGRQDLLKAKHCLDILIEQEYPNATE